MHGEPCFPAPGANSFQGAAHAGRRGRFPPLSSRVTPRRKPMSENVNEDALVEETLVEEVSIDGMCGVY